jgi:signal transduction histidine kinase
MKMKRQFCNLVAFFFAGILLLAAMFVFSLDYVRGTSVIFPVYSPEESMNRFFFFLNFFIPLALCGAAFCGSLFIPNKLIRCLCIAAGLYAAIHSVYVLRDFFTINLCIYCAYIITAVTAFPGPWNLVAAGSGMVLFIVFLFHPPFMGAPPQGIDFTNPSLSEVVPALIYMFITGAAMSLLRSFVEKRFKAEAQVEHLNYVGTKLILFNHRLQELAKNRGEEAVKQDRLRFTRDLHDGCGHAFTNIIAITDGAVSCGPMENVKAQEVFQRIRNQATKGLQETRSILHLIRSIGEPYMNSVDAIYHLKTVFEEVTGIEVEVEWGNMKLDYGSTINTVISRIVQEAFTNSIRHGQATKILIHFWEFPETLSMTVTDNGKGASVIVKGIGLAGMEERLASLGGYLKVSFPNEGGFRLGVTIPLTNAEQT